MFAVDFYLIFNVEEQDKNSIKQYDMNLLMLTAYYIKKPITELLSHDTFFWINVGYSCNRVKSRHGAMKQSGYCVSLEGYIFLKS